MEKVKNLLEILISDQKNTTNIYKPGPYWWKKSLSAARELEKNGLTDFRSSNNTNTAGSAFGDNSITDARRIVETSSIQSKLGMIILNHTPLKKLFDFQVNLTREYQKRLINFEKNKLALTNPDRLFELVKNYRIENSINFGCDAITKFNDDEFSTYYLQILNMLDLVRKNSNLDSVNSFLEIGPGFGANIHLIEQNFLKIRKFIVVDIVPNIWVVTNYLKNFYGDSVIDYLETREMDEIKFKDDKTLEIFVIPPWQIDKISSSIECFYNSNSFVEMTPEIITNYAKNLTRIRTSKTLYNFISYDKFDLKTTIHPDSILEFFNDVTFHQSRHPSLDEDGHKYYFYLGKVSNA